MNDSILSAFLITTLAGLATCIGAIMGITNTKPKPRMISFIMAFSAGVKIF